MWKDRLKDIIVEENLYGEKINAGATNAEIQLFINEVKKSLNIELPLEYADVLKVVNGLEFNGFILYGIDQYLLTKQQNQHINGLIENNKIWYENSWLKQYVFLGESSISWYVYNLTTGKYCELDNPSGSVNETFRNLPCLVDRLMSDALA